MPDVVAHTVVIEAYAGAGQCEGAHTVFMKMLAYGVLPYAYTYSVLIKSLAADGMIMEAKEYVLEMLGKGMKSSFETCVAVIEAFIVDVMSKECPLLTIGPTIPSFYVDKRIPLDKDYGLSLYHLDPTPTTNWLSTKPQNSVVYVSFGSMACLPKAQIEELAWGLKQSDYHFLWVVRASEEDKLPKGFANEVAAKGLIVTWSPQLEVLASEAVGCFFTHCGWNSTLEALVMGVPMIGMPQWTDQPTVAKFVEDVWNVGVRVKVNEEGLVRREEVKRRIIEVMEQRNGKLVENSNRWKDLVNKAI
ncbi:hypothetical protein SOVF_109460, partial [Spinacia oleracea]